MAIGAAWVDGSWIDAGWAVGAWSGPAAVLTGTLADGALENQIFIGQEDVVITLSGDTWEAGQAFNDIRQDIIDGFNSSNNEIGGWNNEVRDKLAVSYVTRDGDKRASIPFPALSGYAIDANETITYTVPASALAGVSSLTATPTFVVTADTLSGTEIVNADTSTAEPTNYEQCDRSGFRQWPGELIRNWDNVYTRRKSVDERHPQLMIKSVSENLKGSPSPEDNEDNFIGVNDVQGEDL